jgi:hypothetical protein
MLHVLRRHPIAMAAHFRHSVVVAYAFPAETLQRLLPPGLVVDALGDVGFAAAAVVQVERMRPAGLPAAFGRPYLLIGYRIFCRFRTPEGRLLRGLHILRSETNSRSMVAGGNLLTHYRYRHAAARMIERSGVLEVTVRSGDGEGDLDLAADLAAPAGLPAGSPFTSLAAARRFAGPLPFTFDYEPQTGSVIVIEGRRTTWHPAPVSIDVRRATFFGSARFGGAAPILANAFHVSGVEYEWRRGVVVPLGSVA